MEHEARVDVSGDQVRELWRVFDVSPRVPNQSGDPKWPTVHQTKLRQLQAQRAMRKEHFGHVCRYWRFEICDIYPSPFSHPLSLSPPSIFLSLSPSMALIGGGGVAHLRARLNARSCFPREYTIHPHMWLMLKLFSIPRTNAFQNRLRVHKTCPPHFTKTRCCYWSRNGLCLRAEVGSFKPSRTNVFHWTRLTLNVIW